MNIFPSKGRKIPTIFLTWTLFAIPAAFAGIPQPPAGLCGQVFGAAGKPVTSGTVTVTYTPQGGGASASVKATVTPMESGVSAFSYSALVPLESEVTGYPVSSNTLPITDAGKTYTRTVKLDGTTITDSRLVTLTRANVGLTERLDLGVAAPYYSADMDRNYQLSLSELLRLFTLYLLSPTHAYHVDPWSYDGYAPGVGDGTGTPSSMDTNGNWIISDTELKAAITLFSATSTHRYRPAAGGGFEPDMGKAVADTGVTDAVAMTREFTGANIDGNILSVDVAINYAFSGTANVASLKLREQLPPGWVFVEGVQGSVPQFLPPSGSGGQLDFMWFPTPTQSGEFAYRVQAPVGQSSLSIQGTGLYQILDTPGETTIPVRQVGTDLMPLVAKASADARSKDTDGDGFSDVTEKTFGSDPLDPNSAPSLPLTAWPILLVLAALGVFRMAAMEYRRVSKQG